MIALGRGKHVADDASKFLEQSPFSSQEEARIMSTPQLFPVVESAYVISYDTGEPSKSSDISNDSFKKMCSHVSVQSMIYVPIGL